MPLLEVAQIRHVSASIRLTDTTATQIDQYAAFIHASADDVIEQALTYVFSKDRDFQEFLKSSQAAQVTPTLRIRKGPSNDAAEPPANEAHKRGAVHGTTPDRCGGIEGMILHRNLCQDHGGAAHRVNFDTPPLKGRCRAPWALSGLPT